jgi:polysaccharide export outer membrane protein
LFFVALVASSVAQERQPEYRLAAGDVVRISVFQAPDLTVETRVTESGTLTFPLVGTVNVGGLTIPAAEQAIANALKKGGFMQSPQVTMALMHNRGNQVSVLGQVTRAGRFPLETATTRLSEVIAIAGGIAPTGADVAIVTGTRDGKPFRRQIDVAGIFLHSRLQDDMVMAPGDVVYVHRQPVFYVYGEVQKPGSYRVERGMSVQQALAQGGGPTLRGTERGLRVYRRVSATEVSEVSPQPSDPVQPDDVLFVRESLF